MVFSIIALCCLVVQELTGIEALLYIGLVSAFLGVMEGIRNL